MSPLTAAQLAQFQDALARLHAERVAEIQARLAQASSERISTDAVASTAGGDEASIEEARDNDLAMVKRDTDWLQEIEAAQRRITEGSYGECLDCGNPVGIERLRASPTAVRCAACQTEYEKRAGRGGKGLW